VLRRNRRGTRAARAGLAAGLLAGGLHACTDTLTQITPEDVAELRVSLDSAEVAIGREIELTAYALDAANGLLVGMEAGWVSDAPGVATVDERGVVTGVATGTARVIAQFLGLADTTAVTVDVAPVLTLSGDSVGFEVAAGTADPPPQSVSVSNSGGLTLSGLAVDSTVYEAGASDWLSAQLFSAVAPTSLQLTTISSSVTTVGIYSATVWVSATNADSSPADVKVTLEVAPGAPSSSAFQIVVGNNQTALTGATVATAPTIVLRDAFDNPVPGATITFAASGGGSANPTAVVTDAQGRASTTWTVSTTGHAMATNGTFQNTLTAGVTGLTPLQFVGHARFSLAAHVSPIFPASCNGCHGNFVFALSHATLVGIASNCNGSFPRVSSAGGDSGANNSVLLLHLTPGATAPCGFNHPEPFAADAPQLVTFRAWIRNGAPNN
jgi:hypothetical protein